MSTKKEAAAAAPKMEKVQDQTQGTGQATPQQQEITEATTGIKYHTLYVEAGRLQEENKKMKAVLTNINSALSLL